MKGGMYMAYCQNFDHRPRIARYVLIRKDGTKEKMCDMCYMKARRDDTNYVTATALRTGRDKAMIVYDRSIVHTG